MKTILIRTQLVLLIIMFVVLLPFAFPDFNVAAQAQEVEHAAVIIILDDSGSMRSSDPTDLRYTAAKLFVSLLDEGDAVGAIRFSTFSQPITNGMEVIARTSDKGRLVELLNPVTPDGYTDVKAAFIETQSMLAGSTPKGDQIVVIFLTDGHPEIQNPYSNYESETLKIARNLEYPVLSIALTPAGNSPFLTRLANETGGRVISADSATDLLDIYLQILGDLKDRTVIGSGIFSAPGIAAIDLDPALIPYIDRVSFIVSKPEAVSAQLVKPDNQYMPITDPSVSYSLVDRRFSVINISQPVGGGWGYELTGRGEVQVRAILRSKLRLRLSSPAGSFEAGKPVHLVVKMVEEQPGKSPINIIGEASFSALITRPDGTQDSLDQFFDDGTNGDQVAGDGLYTRIYPNNDLPGSYQIECKGYKGSVPVSYRTQIQAITFPEIKIDQPQQSSYEIRVDPVPLQIHLEGAELTSLDEGIFTAEITSPSQEITPLQLGLMEDGSFTGSFMPTEEGIHQVLYKSNQARYLGKDYERTAQTSIEVRIIPALYFQEPKINVEEPYLNQRKIELSEAKKGFLVAVLVNSTSMQNEVIQAHLEKMPGFILEEEGKNLSISPGKEVVINLHIKADPKSSTGEVDGKLMFTAQGEVDLHNSTHNLQFTTFKPEITFSVDVISRVSEENCTRWEPINILFSHTSSSLVNEIIGIGLKDIPNATLETDNIQVGPGQSETQINIKPENGKFPAGHYEGNLFVSSKRNNPAEIDVKPEEPISISFSIEPFWVSCKRQIVSGVILTITFIVFLWIAWKILAFLLNRRLNN